MNNFSFQNPTKLIFGKGMIAQLASEIPAGSKILVTFGGGSVKKNGVYQQVVDALKNHTYTEFWGIEPNPTVETLRKAIELGKSKGSNFVLAVGGGSVIDGSKLIAAALRSDLDAWELVKNPSLMTERVPLASVLTLPATGSEMNAGAVISNHATQEKFACYPCYPTFSILDPESTFTLPTYQIACGLTDTFVHVMEQYMTTPGQSMIMDRWAEGILTTLIEIAPKAISETKSYDIMANYMLTATMGLNGFISMGVKNDWATHMIGHELTALHGTTHAESLSLVFPSLLRVRQDVKGDKILQYGERVWGICSGSREERIEATIQKTEGFFASLGLATRLSQKEIGAATITEIEKRFNDRHAAFGEDSAVNGAMARKILETAL